MTTWRTLLTRCGRRGATPVATPEAPESTPLNSESTTPSTGERSTSLPSAADVENEARSKPATATTVADSRSSGFVSRVIAKTIALIPRPSYIKTQYVKDYWDYFTYRFHAETFIVQGVERKVEALPPQRPPSKNSLWRAWNKLEEMRPSCCCIHIYSDYGYVWDISYRIDKGDYDGPHELTRVPKSFGRLEDAVDAMYKLWKEEMKK